MIRSTTSKEFFDGKYRESADPWSFASSPYELSRYEAIIRMLGEGQYHRAFEPGCSVGVLTARLACICQEVLATDISPTAVAQARERCRHLSNVTVSCGTLPDNMPSGTFDLIVFSEIGYYFNEPALRGIINQFTHKLQESGILLAAHWLGESEDHLLSGDRVHEVLLECGGLRHKSSERYGGFRLDLWVA